jgi:hypothetical protein
VGDRYAGYLLVYEAELWTVQRLLPGWSCEFDSRHRSAEACKLAAGIRVALRSCRPAMPRERRGQAVGSWLRQCECAGPRTPCPGGLPEDRSTTEGRDATGPLAPAKGLIEPGQQLSRRGRGRDHGHRCRPAKTAGLGDPGQRRASMMTSAELGESPHLEAFTRFATRSPLFASPLERRRTAYSTPATEAPRSRCR